MPNAIIRQADLTFDLWNTAKWQDSSLEEIFATRWNRPLEQTVRSGRTWQISKPSHTDMDTWTGTATIVADPEKDNPPPVRVAFAFDTNDLNLHFEEQPGSPYDPSEIAEAVARALGAIEIRMVRIKATEPISGPRATEGDLLNHLGYA